MKLARMFAGAVAALALAGALAPAVAAPIPYITAPFETPNGSTNALIQNLNTAQPFAVPASACTGTTTSTCNGLKILTSYTGLTTAAGVTSAAQTVTNSSVTASSILICDVVGYAGTGNPRVTNVIPGAGSFTYLIQNTHASAALNATVTTGCLVYN